MVRGKYVAAVGILTAAVMLSGCEGGSEEKKGQEKKEKQEVKAESTDKSSEKKAEILHFVDVYGQPYEVGSDRKLKSIRIIWMDSYMTDINFPIREMSVTLIGLVLMFPSIRERLIGKR